MRLTVIAIDYSSPISAQRYIQGIHDNIIELERDASIYQIQMYLSLRKYGQNVRRIVACQRTVAPPFRLTVICKTRGLSVSIPLLH
jgi:hypothetical protein